MKIQHCEYCGVEVMKGKNRTIDHFYPLSRGGTNDRENRVISCRVCNRLKDDRVFRDLHAARRWIFQQARAMVNRMKASGIR